jgi:YVTN family beta-propeller protein
MPPERRLAFQMVAASLVLGGCSGGGGGKPPAPVPVAAQQLPNMGQQITPTAPTGSRFESLNPGLLDKPSWLAGQAVSTVVSPDKKTLLVLTSGFNKVYASNSPKPRKPDPDSNEYVFIYDISAPMPVKKQVVQIPNSYNGIAFDPSGTAFYVPGCANDVVHVVTQNADGSWPGTPAMALDLGHPRNSNGFTMGNGLDFNAAPAPVGQINSQVAVQACAAGVGISSDGQTLVVANYYNDSISVFKGGLGRWATIPDIDLRPGKSDVSKAGTAGGEYPFWAVVKGNGLSATAYVSSLRDREIVVVSLGDAPAVTARIPVKGQPNKMTLNLSQSRLYVAEDHTDTVDIIDTNRNRVIESIPVIAPASVMPYSLVQYKGANTNSVTLSPDEKQLYVTNGNLNSVAVVALGDATGGSRVVGLVPTGWYPNSVSFSGDGNTVYVVNGKSPTGANPDFCYSSGTTTQTPLTKNCLGSNQYNPQLIKAGLQSFARPSTAQLATLSMQVAVNNRFSHVESDADVATMAAVRRGVQHVIFVIKENRTYDQILGDLEVGNGDPKLAEFGQALTPNMHQLARQFVTLDNFYATSETSNDGWPWTTSARAPDVIERQFPVAYAGRGLSLDSEGTNRNVNVAIATLAERRKADALTPTDPDVLPGQTNTAAPDGPDNEVNTGYLWDAALRANLTVRNYGFFLDMTRYQLPAGDPNAISLVDMPALATPPTTVAYPSSASLAPFTDPYFRGFDNNFSDYWRFKEWERDFDAAYAPAGGDDLPALTLVRLMHDHTGNFATATHGVGTPETQQADNDYALGLLVEKIAASKYASNTLIFVIEDDAQDGADHVDSHRTIAFVAGAYVKQGVVVATQYNTINFVRTMEEVLGIAPMNLNDALASPMADIFTTTPGAWTFAATPAPILYTTGLPLPARLAGVVVPRPKHNAQYWARATRGMDFSSEDKFDFARYNRILWAGLMGNVPYPPAPGGKDLRQDRRAYLERESTPRK